MEKLDKKQAKQDLIELSKNLAKADKYIKLAYEKVLEILEIYEGIEE